MDDTKATNGAPAKRRGRLLLEPISLHEKLRELGMSPEQADSLVDLVGVIKFELRKRRQQQEGGQAFRIQRQALTAMRDALDKVLASLDQVDQLVEPGGLGNTLRERLDEAGGGDAGPRVQAARDGASGLRPVVREALARMQRGQRRDRVSTTPVRLIHERSGLQPSASETSRFRRVTLALYEAAGFPHENPDASIRAYKQMLRKTAEAG